MGVTVKNVLLEVAGHTQQAQRSVSDLSEEIRRLPNDTEIEIGVEARAARDQIGRIRAELRKVDRTKVSPEVNVEITNALVRMDELEARLRRLSKQKGTLDFEVRRGILSELAAVERGIVGTFSSLDRATAPARTFGDAVHNIGQKVKQLTPLVNGAAIILLTKLLPGLIALAGTATAAAGAVIGLASAFAGALVPTISLAIPVFSRFGKVLDALRLSDQARDAAARATIDGTKAAADASEVRRAAANAERDAIEQLVTASRNLVAARGAAETALADAERARAEAQRQAALSADALGQAAVDAYREMADAAERARDAVLSVEQAQIGVEQASLNVRKAQQALKDFREEAGASADELTAVFKKFTDVDVDMSGLADALDKAGGGNLEAKDKLDLEQLILNVRSAKQDEKSATDALSDSETELSRARQDNARFQRLGIRASQSYTAALEANRDAQRQLIDATAEQRRLEQLGVANAPAVIAATEAVRDAEQRLADARRRKREAAAPASSAQDDAARVAAEKLTGTERILLAVLGRVRDFLTKQFQPAVDSVFGGMIALLVSVPGLVVLVRDKIKGLGDAWRDVLTAFAVELVSPASVLDMRNLTQGATDLARILGADAFVSFLRLMRNLAVLFLPAAVELSRDFAGALRGAASASGDAGNKQKWVEPLVTSFRSVVRFLGTGVKLLAEFGRVVGPIGAEFLDWITGLIDGMREWLASAEGQKDISRFFADTIPAVKSTIKFILRLVRIFLKFFQLTAPFIKGFIDSFDFLFSILEKVLDLLNFIVSNPVGRFIREMIGAFLGFGSILRLIGRVVTVLGGLAARLGGLRGIAAKAVEFLIAPFRAAADVLVRIFTRLAPNLAAKIGAAVSSMVRAVTSRVGRLLGAGRRLIGGLLDGIGARIGEAAGVAGRFISRLAGGFVSIAKRVIGLGGRVLGFLLEGARSIFARLPGFAQNFIGFLARAFVRIGESVFNIGKAILEGLIKGFTTIGRTVFDAIKGLGKKIVDAVKDVLGIHSPSRVMYDLGQFMLQGLLDGFTSQNVADFIRNKLGGIGQLGAELALSVTPIGALRRGIGDLQDALGINVPLLAAGGVTRGPMLAGIGEAGREAVLPLSRRVMRQLAAAITAQMSSFAGPALASSRGLSPAFAGAATGPGGGGIHLHGDIRVESPAGQQPDARVVAVKITRELEARGGSPRQ